ncbi:MAG TPA: hypothetical protein GX726_01915 [Clostridiales bacterium]|jgi:hypothetical protein|nr:hypothetical protein [Clostridiales bacterium]
MNQNAKISSGGTYRQDEIIARLLKEIRIPVHLKGYQCLAESLRITIENPDILNAVTKELYPAVAEACETSVCGVERSIRHAVKLAWEKEGMPERIFEDWPGYLPSGQIPGNRRLLTNLTLRARSWM